MAKVAVLMSGGVDSAYAALRLKEQGHQVEGITARFWDENGSSFSEAIDVARKTCSVLAIRHTVVDLRDAFRQEVLDPFVSAYVDGLTPNPCACCNRDVKLGKLARSARDRGFDFVATGHYARLSEVAGRITFCEPLDKRKSQVYFLALVDPGILEFLMFPLGDSRKEDVRRVVESAGLAIRTRDSQDLCFIAGGRYHDFLERQGRQRVPGQVLDTQGNVVGTHKGHVAYTVGQRFGMKGKRYYVLEKRPETNVIVIGDRDQAYKTKITAVRINLFLPLAGKDSAGQSVRYRYNSPPVGVRIAEVGADRVTVITEKPCFAPAPGQVVAGYRKGCLVFGGIIESAA